MIVPDEAKRFKIFRKHIGKSQIDLAAELKLNQAYISKFENGAYEVSKEAITYLHVKYRMSYEWFFHGTGSKIEKELPKGTLTTDIASMKDDYRVLSEKVRKLETDLRYLASKLTNTLQH